MSPSRIFHLCGGITITGEGLQNFRATPAVIRGIDFAFSSEDLPQSVAFNDSRGDVEGLFKPGSSHLRHADILASN